MVAFFGEYRHKLDAKGRLSLPAAIRKTLTEDTQLVVVPGANKEYISVYTAEAYEAWVDSIFAMRGGYNPGKRDHVMLRKALNSSAMPANMDSAGRIGLSAKQRELAGLQKDVALICDNDHFEIWDEARWDSCQSEIDLDALLYA